MSSQSSGQSLLAKLLKFREEIVDVQGLAEQLEQISKFLQEHETPSSQECTHEVMLGFMDWWVGPKSTKKLAIVEDNTLDTLYKHITAMYLKGVPLTLGEKRTQEFRFLQDIEIRGARDGAMAAQELISEQNSVLRLIGQAMGELYPSLKQNLDVIAFDGSGFNSVIGVMQTSVRLVWPKIVVDRQHALHIMDFITNKLIHSPDESVRTIQTRMKSFHQDNIWKSVLIDSIYCGTAIIRMPLNDHVTPPPVQKPEKRPYKPMGVFRMKFETPTSTEVQSIEVISGAEIDSEQGLGGEDWLKLGSIRQDLGTPLTPFFSPSFKAETRPSHSGYSSSATSGARPERTGGQVKIRSNFGSDDRVKKGPRPGNPGPRVEEKDHKSERSFPGTLEEFRDHIQTCLGSGGTIEVDEEAKVLSWKQTADANTANIVFRSHNHRVYIQGKEHQVRSWVAALGAFITAVPDPNGSVSGTRYGGTSVAPSQAFAPKNGSVNGRSGPTSLASYSANRVTRPAVELGSGNGKVEPFQRIVYKDFKGQTTGEMDLKIDELVTIFQDPEGNSHSLDRWVYGRNGVTKQEAWFPFSHTKALQGSNAGGMEAVAE